MSTSEDRRSGPSGKAVQQAPGLWHTDLQRQDLSVPEREVVQARVDIGPEGRWSADHPDEEIIYILCTLPSLPHNLACSPRSVGDLAGRDRGCWLAV